MRGLTQAGCRVAGPDALADVAGGRSTSDGRRAFMVRMRMFVGHCGPVRGRAGPGPDATAATVTCMTGSPAIPSQSLS